MKLSSLRKLPVRQAQILAALSLAVLVAGCAYTPGVSLPIQEGDIARGRQAFIDHQCHQCHSIAGLNLPALAGAGPVQLELGGEVIAVRSYAELLTSIINPNHIVSESYRQQLQLEATVPLDSPMPMPHIDNMSVRQLIDLVAFLDSRYVLIEEYDSDT
ncbi:MAG: c-type cytochrome [Gammaproteobacteria bacterium]|nr:c-type cytochrome [Gammaproteobacteria bacterium]